MIEMQKWKKVIIASIVLLLFLSLVPSFLLSKNSAGSGGETGVLGQTAPLIVDLRVAVISSDSGFVEGVRSAFVARDFRVVPVSRAWEAVGKDLVVVGWDALGELSRDPGLVVALVNGSRLLAVAEPGMDALRVLFSGIVKPVRLGEKDEPSDPFAFLPMVEENGYLYPGCGHNMVLVRGISTKGGKLAMEYTVTTLKAKSDLPKIAPLLVKKSLEKQQQQQTRLENRAGTWRPMLYVSPTWVYIGSYFSDVITFSGKNGVTAGETDFGVVAGWGQDTYDPSYGTYLWEIMLYYHGERGLNGYSPPVKIAGLWNIEPNAAILDARTDTYSDQRVTYISPTGQGNDGQVTITFSYPPGLSFTQDINPQVTWETNYNSYYSAKYGGYVKWQAIWKWGLTSYSSNQYYAMAGLVWMESVNPLFFKVIIKANAYLATRGIADIASSGEQVFYFRADTSILQRTG
ncbi:hypothetical protein TCARB_0245 [Thermofilum adornatum 1505]|uniref:Uncharacterized protein n=2 Tax=Thermofilum adornatum TaxID=1365176 RepID=A0A3G1A7S2_9CREN|nr:hypothetical protein TCARB_0245 [Thermofilum adornatum 1505]